jgi:hypothetical protein
VSRLDYAPRLKDIKVTNIKKGIGVFTPKPDKAVSFAALKETLKKAGYALDTADIAVLGTLTRDQEKWTLVALQSGQRFELEGGSLEQLVNGAAVNSRVQITGAWKTIGEGAGAREVISPRMAKKLAGTTGDRFDAFSPSSRVRFMAANFIADEAAPSPDSFAMRPDAAKSLAPIRVTSPGLTVYKGGAFTPRLYFIEQHLGDLDVSRQVLDLSISYTPSPRVQLEIEVPFSRTSFDNGTASGSGSGLGNVTVWSKYRFFRKVKTYGDRQAAVRFGLELPTGKKTAPSVAEINAPAFVRQQLTPINGGLSPHFDLAFSQAGGRIIFGGNVEGIFRSERAGYRVGHEVRASTDLEYVLLPRKYDTPGGELFVILETIFLHRTNGHVDGLNVPGSNSTEYYLAPGLQYAAQPRFVIEGSIQLPVVRNTGPLVLRTDRNLLLGIRYLF